MGVGTPLETMKGPDAVSRQPSPLLAATLAPTCSEPISDIINITGKERILNAGYCNLYSAASCAVSLDDVRTEGKKYKLYSSLI